MGEVNTYVALRVESVVVVVLFLLVLFVHSQQVESTARLDFLWKVQVSVANRGKAHSRTLVAGVGRTGQGLKKYLKISPAIFFLKLVRDLFSHGDANGAKNSEGVMGICPEVVPCAVDGMLKSEN